MARVPVVESPCPIAGKRVPSGASEHCSTCDRAVFNLNSMNETARREFMSGCSGKVCIAYTVRVPVRRRVLGAVTLAAAALVALPAAAGEAATPAPTTVEPPAGAMSPVTSAEAELPKCDEYDDMVIVGGVLEAENAQWQDDGTDDGTNGTEAAPALPIVEDDGR